MAEYNVMTTAQIAAPKAGDKIYTYEGYGVKKIGLMTTGGTNVINYIHSSSSLKVIEFPQLGKSLPCVFDIMDSTRTTTTEQIHLYFIVMEYGGQPDPKYFDIIGLDEVGMPIYADEGE